MGLLRNVLAVITGVGILVSEALLIFMALAYLAQLSLELVVVRFRLLLAYRNLDCADQPPVRFFAAAAIIVRPAQWPRIRDG